MKLLKILTEASGMEYFFGYDMDALENLVYHLERKYEDGVDYIAHIGRGDDMPNALTIRNSRMLQDKVLMNLIDDAEGEELEGLDS